MGRPAGAGGAVRPRVQARADGARAVPVPPRHLLSLGPGVGGDMPGACARTEGPGRGRPAHRELRNLARHRGPSDLGHQRFRRGVPDGLHERPGAPGDLRAALDRRGNPDPDPPRRLQRDPRGLPLVDGEWRPAVRARRGAPRAPPRRRVGVARPGALLDGDDRSSARSPPAARGGLASASPVSPWGGSSLRHPARRAREPRAPAHRCDRRALRRLDRARGQGARRVRRRLGAGSSGAVPIHYPTIVRRAVRCADPFLEVRGRWVLRRLAPDCSRIEFTVARLAADQTDLLHAMGAETANVHIGSGSRRIAAVSADLAKRSPDWLKVASRAMERATLADQIEWQRAQRA